MQTHTTPAEITRRFSCIKASNEQRVKSETIAQQIAEYEARGGKIHVITSPQFSVQPKRISTGHDPQFLNQTKNCVKPSSDGLVNLTKAAKVLNVHLTTVSWWVKQKKLEVIETRKRGEKMVRLSDASALKNARDKGAK
jgi:hypothetical protein